MAKGKETGLQTKELSDWQKKLAEKAVNAKSMVQLGIPRITHKGGALRMDGALIKGNELEVVIIDSCLSNEFYEGAYVEGEAAVPVCYAFGTDPATMAPHPECAKPQSPTCATCDKNVFGSAETGRGKACKNNARLLLVSRSKNPDGYIKADKRQISVPPTSLRNYSEFMSSLGDAGSVTGDAMEVLTKIKAGPRPKGSGHELTFEVAGLLPEAEVEKVFLLSEKNKGLLTTPYPKLEEKAAQPTIKRKSRKLD